MRSGQIISGQHSESKVISLVVALVLGVGQGDWFDPRAWFMILDSGFSSCNGLLEQNHEQCWRQPLDQGRFQNRAWEFSKRFRQVHTRLALNRRSTQNHDVTFHIVTPPVRIQSKLFSLPILGLWLTNAQGVQGGSWIDRISEWFTDASHSHSNQPSMPLFDPE